MNNERAEPIKDCTQNLEFTANVEVGDVSRPLLMGQLGLPEPLTSRARLSGPTTQPPMNSQNSVNRGRLTKSDFVINH